MAEGRASAAVAKPAEFYLGLLDFFATLLPGAIAAAEIVVASLYVQRHYSLHDFREKFSGVAYWPWWAGFALAAYVLGHLLFLVGSLTLDNVYDLVYPKVRRPEHTNMRLRVERVLADPPISLDEIDSRLQWALCFGKLRAPAAMTDVERLEADSKFFRSLTVLLLLTDALFPVVQGPPLLGFLSPLLGRIAALLSPVLVLLAAWVVPDWRAQSSAETDEICKRAFALYQQRAKSSVAASDEVLAVRDWLGAEKEIDSEARRRKIVWVGFAGLWQVLACVPLGRGGWIVHVCLALCVGLCAWRFMDRRHKHTMLGYRVFLASAVELRASHDGV